MPTFDEITESYAQNSPFGVGSIFSKSFREKERSEVEKRQKEWEERRLKNNEITPEPDIFTPGNGDDFFEDGTGKYLGRSLKGTGDEGKGLIRILKIENNTTPPYIKQGSKMHIDDTKVKYASPWTDYVYDVGQQNTEGTSTNMAKKIFKHYMDLLMPLRENVTLNYEVFKEKIPEGVVKQKGSITFPSPAYGFEIYISTMGVDANGDKGIMYFSSETQGIHLCIDDNGEINRELSHYSIFISTLLHEYIHLCDFKTENARNPDVRHMEIYFMQIIDDTFLQMPKKGKLGMMARYKYYLEKVDNEQNVEGNNNLRDAWLSSINMFSNRTGFKIDLNSGDGWGASGKTGYSIIAK